MKRPGQPVVTAQIELVDTTGNVVGRALSDTAGSFFIQAEMGTYAVVVTRLGYEPMYVMEVSITDMSTVPVQIRLSPDAVLLPGLVVEGERRLRYLTINGFFRRQELGFGHFIEMDRLKRLQTQDPTQLVRGLPGIKTQRGQVFSSRGQWNGKPCLLQVVVDDVYRGANLDVALIVEEIEAIEVYNGLSNTPPRWKTIAARGSYGVDGRRQATCGVVVVWTKH